MPTELLIAGPAGTGKTYAIVKTLHCLCADEPNLRVLFVRSTRAALTESVLVTYEQEILAADGCEAICQGVARSHRHSYKYPNGSELVLAGLDRNPVKALSTAYDIVFANEAVELTQESWETIASRLNRPGRDARFGWLIGDTNPTFPSHWLKLRCDQGKTVLWNTSHEANPALHDGSDWTEAGRTYLATLDKLSGTRLLRLRKGVWAAGEGLVFPNFDPEKQVTDAAEYDPLLPVFCSIDSGSQTGAVWFQVRQLVDEFGQDIQCCTVFADYYSKDRGAYNCALDILEVTAKFAKGRRDRIFTDPAGSSRTPIGPTVLGEYERAGLKKLEHWPSYPGSVEQGIRLVDSFVRGDGASTPTLLIHPRCKSLINAFAGYMNAKVGNEFIERPADPQHPHEDIMDALRGGLMARFPEGRRPERKFSGRVPIRGLL